MSARVCVFAPTRVCGFSFWHKPFYPKVRARVRKSSLSVYGYGAVCVRVCACALVLCCVPVFVRMPVFVRVHGLDPKTRNGGHGPVQRHESFFRDAEKGNVHCVDDCVAFNECVLPARGGAHFRTDVFARIHAPSSDQQVVHKLSSWGQAEQLSLIGEHRHPTGACRATLMQHSKFGIPTGCSAVLGIVMHFTILHKLTRYEDQ